METLKEKDNMEVNIITKEVELKGICKHCRHRKVKKIGNMIAADYCKHYAHRPTCYPECFKCRSFSQSIKSRLGFIK